MQPISISLTHTTTHPRPTWSLRAERSHAPRHEAPPSSTAPRRGASAHSLAVRCHCCCAAPPSSASASTVPNFSPPPSSPMRIGDPWVGLAHPVCVDSVLPPLEEQHAAQLGGQGLVAYGNPYFFSRMLSKSIASFMWITKFSHDIWSRNIWLAGGLQPSVGFYSR